MHVERRFTDSSMLLAPSLSNKADPVSPPRVRRVGDTPGSLTIFEGSFDEYREMLHNRFDAAGLLKSGQKPGKM